ncbi:MAG TPA: PcfJ domain-containing protein [Candidatus Ozemobacteraceae bacterium]|nr:PcfJ domain-containing protein [Candidatus Ozemobacteraceae bacterium]
MKSFNTLLFRIDDERAATEKGSVSIGEDVALEVESHEGGAAARLFRHIPMHGDRVERLLLWALAVQVRPPVSFRAGFITPRLDLIFEPGAGSADGSDPFFDVSFEKACADDRLLRKANLPKRKDVTDSLRAFQRHLVRCLIPEAAQIAGLFPADGSMRWWIYGQIANDRTGRIAQMAKVCPGVLIMARKMDSLGDHRLNILLESIVRGERLGKVLDTTVEFWRLITGNREPAERCRDQRRRISGAGIRISPSLLWRLPHGAVVPEDIPSDPMDNQAWYDIQCESSLKAVEHLSLSARTSFLAFTSRHAIDIARLAREKWPEGNQGYAQERFLGSLTDFIQATGRQPARSTRLDKLVEECDRWHRRMAHELPDFLRRGRGEEPPLPPESPLDPGLFADLLVWRQGPDVIRFLRTAGDLVEESQRMQHCVRSYARKAAAGNCQLFHGELAGEPVTIEIADGNGRPVLRQVSGLRNKRPGEPTYRQVMTWFGDLTAAIQAGSSGVPPKLVGSFEKDASAIPVPRSIPA